MNHQHGCGHDHDHDHDHSHFDHSHDCGRDHDREQAQSFEPGPEIDEVPTQTCLYRAESVEFRYPQGWSVHEESTHEQTTITVQSAGTSYWTLTLFADQPDPEAIIDSVIDAYQEMYEELDVYDSGIEIPGIDSLARELDFVCLDLVSSASLLIFQPGTQTVLVMFQGEDRELEKTRPLLEAMTRSILCENA